MSDLQKAMDDLLNTFGHHFIALYIDYEDERGLENKQLFSCFVMEARGCWFLVSAGHCFEELKKIIEKYSNRKISLIDSASSNNKFPPLPIAVESREILACDEDNFVCDYGAIRLRDLFVENLKRNGISPLSEEVWREQPGAFDSYYLMGVPTEDIYYIKTPDDANLKLTYTLIPVKEITPGESRIEVKDNYGFYGILSGIGTLDSIKGMSGGPILGLKKCEDGELRYWLVAVQSRWNKDGLNILASRACYLGVCLEKYLEMLEAEGEV